MSTRGSLACKISRLLHINSKFPFRLLPLCLQLRPCQFPMFPTFLCQLSYSLYVGLILTTTRANQFILYKFCQLHVEAVQKLAPHLDTPYITTGRTTAATHQGGSNTKTGTSKPNYSIAMFQLPRTTKEHLDTTLLI